MDFSISFPAVEGILVFLIGLSLLAYAAIFLSHPQAPRVQPTLVAVQSWKEKILQELSFLEGPFHKEKPKEAMARFAALVDTYVHQSYGLDSTPLTTTEILENLSRKGLKDETDTIAFLLKESDWVKFSLQKDREDHWQELFSRFKKMVLEP